MSLKLELLELYESSLKEGTDIPVEVQTVKEVSVGQIREITSIPPERFIIIGQEGDLFITAPVTSYIELLPRHTPLYRLRSWGLRLGVVPAWDFLRREFIEKYSYVLGRANEEEVEKVKSYLKSVDINSVGWTVKRFIRLNSKRWAKWTMASLLVHADMAEQGAVVVRLTPEVESRMDRYRTYALAAENRYFRGENFLAVLTERGLRLYLPDELLGKKVRISAGDVVLFEGELESTSLEMEGNFSRINPEEVIRVVEI